MSGTNDIFQVKEEKPTRRRGVVFLFAVAGVLVVGIVLAGMRGSGEPGVAQPIEFPHRVHAGSVADGGYGISCLYCHSYARRSTVAGIPALSKCMGCHRFIATDKEPIKKLTAYWESGTPVPWNKVHDLPDFVHFPHERHVQHFIFRLGQPVSQVCGYCHGDVKAMTVAQKTRPLTMGWCLGCHEQFQGDGTQVPTPAADWLVPASDDERLAMVDHKVAAKAPGDCWECHK